MSETEIERMNPKPGGRWLSLPITAAIGDDVFCMCIICGHTTKPVEYIVHIHGYATTTWRGLHAQCWERNQSADGGALIAALQEHAENKDTLLALRELLSGIVGLVETSGEVTIGVEGGREWEALKRRFVELGGGHDEL